MSNRSSAKSVADISAGVILARVDIAASPERVFRALTASDEIMRWWGSCEAYTTTSWVSDLRVGGAWKAEGRGADGAPFSVSGKFLEVNPPHKLVKTWTPDWDGGHETKVTYQLDATDDGTRLTVRHEGFVGRADSCEQHTAGWEAVLGWLSGYLEPMASADHECFYMFRLFPPRPTFPQDMTAEEEAMMQKHVAYWTHRLRDGTAIVFGPVADPDGPWGLGVIRAASDQHRQELQANDPAILSGKGFRYETLPMLRAFAKA